MYFGFSSSLKIGSLLGKMIGVIVLFLKVKLDIFYSTTSNIIY